MSEPAQRRFSTPVLPGRGASDYERYLRTDELLSLQKTPEERVHRDELLFQTVHQIVRAVAEARRDREPRRRRALIERRQALAPALRLMRRVVLCLQLRHRPRSRCSTR